MPDLEERKRFLQLGPDDAARLAAQQPVVAGAAPEIAARFYDHLLGFEALHHLLADEAVVERLRSSKCRHLAGLFSGEYGAQFAEQLHRVGHLHHRIGLEPRWYLGAYALQLRLLAAALAEGCPAGEAPPALDSLLKLAFLDLGIAVESYIEAGRAQLEQARIERGELEAKLRVSERLASVGTLAAGVAHEINNPLAYVVANLDFLARALPALLPAREPGASGERAQEALRALEDCREGAGRVRVIVRDLKTFARADQPEPPVPLELSEVVEAAVVMARAEIHQRALLRVSLGALPPISGSPSRLGQVFLNLLVNAAHSIPEGAAASHRVEVTASTRADGCAVVEISDTGCGIPAALLSRIFDPFFTTKPPGAGTGLGLAICHEIVAAHRGSLGVESRLGEGSRFRVVLPPAGEGLPATPVPRPEAPPGIAARLLVIDDDQLVGQALRRLLEDQHSVTAVTGAPEALARLAAGERFDAVLCDLMMPGVSGMELHARLLQLAPELAARTLFLTGGTVTAAAREFADRHRARCLHKPIDEEELRRSIQELLASAGPLRDQSVL